MSQEKLSVSHSEATEAETLMEGTVSERSPLDELLTLAVSLPDVEIDGQVATKQAIYCTCGIPGGGCFEVTLTVPADHEPDIDDVYIKAHPEFGKCG